MLRIYVHKINGISHALDTLHAQNKKPTHLDKFQYIFHTISMAKEKF